MTTSRWQPDVLPGFEQLTLPLRPDAEGGNVATLVRRVAPPSDTGVDVLYVHGWWDYFFQTHLAEFWESLGVRFWALDLRKYGRSLRPHQTPGHTDSLATYAEEIDAALAVMGHHHTSGRGRRLVLMGHSTGGLVLSLWAHHNPGRAHALVLNAPWLELHTGQAGRRLLDGVLRVQGAVAPRRDVVHLDPGHYVRSISARHEGEWDFSQQWRPETGWPIKPTWLGAILRGHERVAQGLAIDVPVLVLLSTRFVVPWERSEDLMCADTVLDVDVIAERAPLLGPTVTIARIEGALHDVTLSAPEVRERVWRETARWFRGYIGEPTWSDAARPMRIRAPRMRTALEPAPS